MTAYVLLKRRSLVRMRIGVTHFHNHHIANSKPIPHCFYQPLVFFLRLHNNFEGFNPHLTASPVFPTWFPPMMRTLRGLVSHPAEREAADAPSCVLFRLLTSSPSSLSESGVRGGADVSCGNLQDEADLGGVGDRLVRRLNRNTITLYHNFFFVITHEITTKNLNKPLATP